MGVGTPERSRWRAWPRGVDMFDCVMPTRNAAQRLAVHPLRRRQDQERRHTATITRPLDESLRLAIPAATSRARYLHHFAPGRRDPRRAPEYHPQPALLPLQLMAEMREAIEQHRFEAFRLRFRRRPRTRASKPRRRRTFRRAPVE
ncbi:hypothetical protein ACU4GD_35450 [Cupriavidus basilensis]